MTRKNKGKEQVFREDVEDLKALLAEQEDKQHLDDLRHNLKTKAGRRQMWTLIERTGVFRQSFTGTSETYFREGQRDIGLQYLGEIIEHMPDIFILMLQDRIEDKERREEKIRAAEAQHVESFSEDGG